jgi:hypothetical protein
MEWMLILEDGSACKLPETGLPCIPAHGPMRERDE